MWELVRYQRQISIHMKSASMLSFNWDLYPTKSAILSKHAWNPTNSRTTDYICPVSLVVSSNPVGYEAATMLRQYLSEHMNLAWPTWQNPSLVEGWTMHAYTTHGPPPGSHSYNKRAIDLPTHMHRYTVPPNVCRTTLYNYDEIQRGLHTWAAAIHLNKTRVMVLHGVLWCTIVKL